MDAEQSEQNLGVLLQHFSSVFETLGGTAAADFDEWSRLHRMVVRDASLRALPLEELYSRALLHFQNNHFNLLLLMALVQASAMDVVLAECGAPRLLSAPPVDARGTLARRRWSQRGRIAEPPTALCAPNPL